MAGNRDMNFPAGQPGFNNMMSGAQQFIQPGMPCYPMMQQPMGMNAGMVPRQMYPIPQYQMAAPRRMAPPSYNQHIAQNLTRNTAPGSGPRPRPPPSQKDLQFQLQQQRLKQFGQTKHVKADADKFIESMFGKTEKPKSKDLKAEAQQEIVAQQIPGEPGEPEDDGFGDFLQGPMSAPVTCNTQPTTSTPNTPSQSIEITTEPSQQTNIQMDTRVPHPSISRPEEEKKDLMSMMLACSDLKNPQKAKLFQKPLVKDVQVQPHKNITYHQSQQARSWQASTELEGLFHQAIPEPELTVQPVSNDQTSNPLNTGEIPTSSSNTVTTSMPNTQDTLPDWCHLHRDKLPSLYIQVYEAALVDGKIDTNRVYPILILSSLPREVLGYIWSLANTTTPGQLIQSELNAVLALIALAQNNHSIMNIEILKRCPQPPIPYLGHIMVTPTTSTSDDLATAAKPVDNSNPGSEIESSCSNQAVITSSASSFQVVAPIPVHSKTGITAIPACIKQFVPVHVGKIHSEPAIITHTSEEDFADFQSADKNTTEDEFGEFIGPSNPARISVEEKPPYVISVPKPDPKMIDNLTADEKYNSNVRSFFGGSSGSSGHTTPNSLEEEDFTDCRDSTSQFSTSEQSENEDIKAFESYVEEFNRKKEKLHPESPLHNPFPRLPAIDKSSTNTVIPTLPMAFGGLQLSSEATPDSDFNDFKSAPNLSRPQHAAVKSDQEFADFKSGGTSPNLSKSNKNLLGEEDKYGALRSLVIEEPPVETEQTKASVPFAHFEEAIEQNESENDWADFASATSEINKNNIPEKSAILNLYETKSPDSDWANFEDTITPTAENINDQLSWTSPSVPHSLFTEEANKGTNSSHLTSSDVNQTEDDWSDFSTAASHDQQAPSSNIKPEDDWFNNASASLTDSTSSSSSNVVTVKKSLQQDEIMGVFKVCNDPSMQSSYKLSTFEQQQKKARQISLDDDNELVPPPLDYHEEEDDHDFSRGYDLEEFHNPSPVAGYGYTNQNKAVCLNQVAKKVTEKNERERSSLSPETEDDSYSSKESYNWKNKSMKFREDSQSICSLELPAKGNRTGSDNGGSDSQSVSSMEFCNFEGSSKTPVSVESKSLDSLDFPADCTEVEEVVDSTEFKNSGVLDNITNSTQSTQASDEGVNSTQSTQASDEGINSTKSTQASDEGINSTQLTSASGDSINSTESTLACGVMKALADKYNITDEIITSDRHSYEWERCLDNCWRMIKDSNTIFNSISSSSVCNEVLRSSRGSSYITGIVEIFRVACRVMTAMNAHNLATPHLQRLIKDIDLAWTNLTAFLVGAAVLPESKSFDFQHGVLKSDADDIQFYSCGVCLLNVDTKVKATSGAEDVSKLTYGRRQYHAACANFWVNCVDSTLPGLRLPELL